MAEIGDLCESRGEMDIEWKIRCFSSLSQEINAYYYSPKFYFSGASWQIKLYPNGKTKRNSDGWLGVYLLKCSNGSPITLKYHLSYRTVDEKVHNLLEDTYVFEKKNSGWGQSRIILKSEVMEKMSAQTPIDTLTIICTLKNSKQNYTSGSLFNRLQKISDNLKEIYIAGKKTDCIIKIEGKEILTHKMILETRSPVFAIMFNHDTKENQNGEICIDDIEKSTMHEILMHMYTGDINKLTTENVLSLYAAFEKYDLKGMKEVFSEFIVRNLSVDWICDVIKFFELYQDENVSFHARQYFKENVREILKTEKWKLFSKENHSSSIELLEFVLLA